ncbi:MAG: hypothetical protein IPP71_10340 [Bacteroidetes bacterium]|nr:hypothetical protein [Bacteroidota bacterium]
MDWYTQLDRSLFCDFGVVASASRQGKILTLCLDYEGNPSGGWSVVLHEVAHFSNVARLPGRDATPEQRERGEVETYVTQRDEGVYPNPMPYSLRNADSYAMFVKEVGDPNWNEESNPGRIAPNLELGGVMSLDGQYRLGTAGRLLWTPIGRNSQMTFGLSGLWFPEQGNTQNNSIPPDSLRAYTGAEIGFRWISEGHAVQFVLDVAGGGGAYFRTDEQVDTALASRIGLGVRIGGPQLGIGISVEAMKLFNLSDSDLTRDVTRDWLGGLMITGHWGGTSANPR